MKITFLGTRGYTRIRTRAHRMHSCTVIEHQGTTLMFDRGLDWQHRPYKPTPDALFITHAHPDHAWGIDADVPCEVYASAASWNLLQSYGVPSHLKHVVYDQKTITIGPFTIMPHDIIHSIRAPAMSYRISVGDTTLFYSGDVAHIPDRAAWLTGVDVYIGDGASIYRSMIRKKGDAIFGHASIVRQLGWCRKSGVARALFTHCGTQIISTDGRTMRTVCSALGRSTGVEVAIVHDNQQIVL